MYMDKVKQSAIDLISYINYLQGERNLSEEDVAAILARAKKHFDYWRR